MCYSNGTITSLSAGRMSPVRATSSNDHEEATTCWVGLVDSELKSGRNFVFDAALAEMERKLLPIIMERCGNSQVKASRALGITRGSLRKKLRQHGLLAPSPGRYMSTLMPRLAQ